MINKIKVINQGGGKMGAAFAVEIKTNCHDEASVKSFIQQLPKVYGKWSYHQYKYGIKALGIVTADQFSNSSWESFKSSVMKWEEGVIQFVQAFKAADNPGFRLEMAQAHITIRAGVKIKEFAASVPRRLTKSANSSSFVVELNKVGKIEYNWDHRKKMVKAVEWISDDDVTGEWLQSLKVKYSGYQGRWHSSNYKLFVDSEGELWNLNLRAVDADAVEQIYYTSTPIGREIAKALSLSSVEGSIKVADWEPWPVQRAVMHLCGNDITRFKGYELTKTSPRKVKAVQKFAAGWMNSDWMMIKKLQGTSDEVSMEDVVEICKEMGLK
jgi:hypothetical protein